MENRILRFFYSIENFEFLWDNIFREDIEVGLSLCSYREKLKNFVVFNATKCLSRYSYI